MIFTEQNDAINPMLYFIRVSNLDVVHMCCAAGSFGCGRTKSGAIDALIVSMSIQTLNAYMLLAGEA